MLNIVLANTYVLASKYQHYHWNVKGPNFKPLHDFFGEQYHALSEQIDDLAERIRALDKPVDGSLTTYIKDATISLNVDSNIFESLLKDYDDLIGHLKKAAGAAGEDLATQDLLVEHLRAHEKTRWMIRAHLIV